MNKNKKIKGGCRVFKYFLLCSLLSVFICKVVICVGRLHYMGQEYKS